MTMSWVYTKGLNPIQPADLNPIYIMKEHLANLQELCKGIMTILKQNLKALVLASCGINAMKNWGWLESTVDSYCTQYHSSSYIEFEECMSTLHFKLTYKWSG